MKKYQICLLLALASVGAVPNASINYKAPTALVKYAESRGVKFERMSTDSASLYQLLFKLAYGVKDQTYFDYTDRKNVEERLDNARIASALSQIARTGKWEPAVAQLEPKSGEYRLLSRRLAQIYTKPGEQTRLLTMSVNGHRLLNRFSHYDRMLHINIPQGRLNVIDKGSEVRLSMAVKVGSSVRRTPRFYTAVRQVNLFPYWTAPAGEVKSYLDQIHANTIGPKYFAARKKDGRRFDFSDKLFRNISVKKFNKRYWLKREPGADNPLGVVRINFHQSFEDIYLHDTNERKAFCDSPTMASHGCIRLQKPLTLTNLLLASRSDWRPLKYADHGCYQVPAAGIKPENKPYLVKGVIPVFVTYFPAFGKNGGVAYRDVYKKFTQQ
ncbi:hypothetical protein GCM10023189_01850 [Nibrella saemangeumensis]|uniref:L,D-TPase catalytic domain-containing protein n=1 Tax=Nibrella saemangeumensis TaxID=1084526 RepID=A0ABP8M8Z2_9BACT